MPRFTRTTVLLLLFAFLASACGLLAGPTEPPIPTATRPEVREEAAPWWREIVFYEIFVRSFKDSDGDGIGDFNGIVEKLDYLQELGVGGIWLMPIHPSPSYHGYDVTDYYAVNPDYGTMEDFKRLLEEARKRNIRVIIDLVLNHTSNQHPFFRAALDSASPFHDWYIWSDAPQAWGQWHPTQPNGPYYYGFFCECMPDLNYANPEVTAEMEKVVNFWLADVGVDGFRLDAAKHLFEADGRIENVPATHEWFAEFYRGYKSVAPEAYTVGEVYGAGAFLAKTYESQMDQVFNFELASGFLNSANAGVISAVDSAYKFSLNNMPNGNYATFLANHDQNRVMTVLNGNVEKAKVAAALLLTAPGTPFLYYGEEIGMTGAKPDEMIRTPMQWSADANAGFTLGVPWEPVNPDFAQVNVAAQTDDPASLLAHYRALVRLRNAHPALRTGSATLVPTNHPSVFALLRADENEAILALVNLGGEFVRAYQLDLREIAGKSLRPLFGWESSELPLSPHPIEELAPYAVSIFQIR
ncbi:MAG: alpha-amylase family glycosyl hydrolase [Chloroflexota bacterium]